MAEYEQERGEIRDYGMETQADARESEVERLNKEIERLSQTISRLEDRLQPVLALSHPIAEVGEKVSGSALLEARVRLSDHVTSLGRLIDRIEA